MSRRHRLHLKNGDQRPRYKPIVEPLRDDGTRGPCPICGRPLVDGPSIDRHHWTPRSQGGKDWSYIHRICHKKIHSLYSAKELARHYARPEDLLALPEMADFVRWVIKQPPEYIGRHAKPTLRR